MHIYIYICLTFLKKILEGFLKKCWKNVRDNFSKCLKSRERKTKSGTEASTLPKCKLFTQMLFLKDSILKRPTASNVINNSQSVLMFLQFHRVILIQIHFLRKGMSQWKGVTPQMLLMKPNKVSY